MRSVWNGPRWVRSLQHQGKKTDRRRRRKIPFSAQTTGKVPSTKPPQLTPEPESEPEPIYRPATPPSTAQPPLHHIADATYATAYTVDEPSPPKKAAVVKKMVPAGTNLAARKAALAAKKKRNVSSTRRVLTPGRDQHHHRDASSRIPRFSTGTSSPCPRRRLTLVTTHSNGEDYRQINGQITKHRYASHAITHSHPVVELVSPPDLPQPKVNKCLIALVAKKLVTKTSDGVRSTALIALTSKGKTVYHWQGP